MTSTLKIPTLLSKLRITWKLVYKLYIPPFITCISFIEIGQVVPENWVLKAVNIYKIYIGSMPSTSKVL